MSNFFFPGREPRTRLRGADPLGGRRARGIPGPPPRGEEGGGVGAWGHSGPAPSGVAGAVAGQGGPSRCSGPAQPCRAGPGGTSNAAGRPAAGRMTSVAGTKKRGYETLRDMLLSLGVILAGVLVFV